MASTLPDLVLALGGEINAILEHAALEGKEDGARSEAEVPPPSSRRPSVSPPGAVKNAGVAKRAPESP